MSLQDDIAALVNALPPDFADPMAQRAGGGR